MKTVAYLDRMSDASVKARAMQLGTQMPESREDCLRVIEMLRHLVDVFHAPPPSLVLVPRTTPVIPIAHARRRK